ncbi:MAG: aminoacyl-tRNA hydrolase [Halobacteriovorax sp.]|nr:aminoacyl-tRNA hydrolase [Halobacteriovorax sp.]
MIPYTELKFTYSRSSGAGGQNVNKVNSKVTLEWAIDNSSAISPEVIARFKKRYPNLINNDGVVQLTSQESRSQGTNQGICIKKLNSLVESVMHAPKHRKKTKPKRSSVLERLNTKRVEGLKKKLRGKVDF